MPTTRPKRRRSPEEIASATATAVAAARAKEKADQYRLMRRAQSGYTYKAIELPEGPLPAVPAARPHRTRPMPPIAAVPGAPQAVTPTDSPNAGTVSTLPRPRLDEHGIPMEDPAPGTVETLPPVADAEAGYTEHPRLASQQEEPPPQTAAPTSRITPAPGDRRPRRDTPPEETPGMGPLTITEPDGERRTVQTPAASLAFMRRTGRDPGTRVAARAASPRLDALTRRAWGRYEDATSNTATNAILQRMQQNFSKPTRRPTRQERLAEIEARTRGEGEAAATERANIAAGAQVDVAKARTDAEAERTRQQIEAARTDRDFRATQAAEDRKFRGEEGEKTRTHEANLSRDRLEAEGRRAEERDRTRQQEEIARATDIARRKAEKENEQKIKDEEKMARETAALSRKINDALADFNLTKGKNKDIRAFSRATGIDVGTSAFLLLTLKDASSYRMAQIVTLMDKYGKSPREVLFMLEDAAKAHAASAPQG